MSSLRKGFSVVNSANTLWFEQVSTLAASGVVISAFAQRANFYSATVYLAQSNACLMVSSTLTSFTHHLQRPILTTIVGSGIIRY